MDEHELVIKAQADDKEALEALLYNNYSIIYAYLLKLTMNEETARDITQETMVKVILNIRKFKGESKLSTWLISIASNVYKDSLRRNKRISIAEIENLPLTASDDVEEAIIKRDSLARIKKALLEIPEKKRMIFILKHFYGYSYEEIAKIAKCPLGTVRSRLHYCIKKLREIIE